LSAVLVVAGVAASISAEAYPAVIVGVGFPGEAVIEPVGYVHPFYGPGFWAGDRYWHHEFERGRYDRFHHERWYRR
jgi:hypothetical protein